MEPHSIMNVPAASVRSQVSDAEWQQRVDLAACYRLVARYGWDDLIFTHISARVPGPEHHFLINPYGMLFDEITASSLVKVDLDGRKVLDSPYDINPAGFTIHSAIHAARDDAKCVLHMHSAQRRRGLGAGGRPAAAVAAVDRRAGLARVSRLRGHRARRRREAAAGPRPRRQDLLHAAQPRPADRRRDRRRRVRLHVPLRGGLRDPGARAGRPRQS